MKIITYATHNDGLFEELSKNKEIVVLGFGTKWEGFIGKAKLIYSYLETLNNDEIVVIVDGFDSIIKNTVILEKFKSFDCKVLVSMEDKSSLNSFLPSFLHNYIKLKVFGTCKNGITANSGLCMGYVNYLKTTFNSLINGKSSDDQRNLNSACNILPFLKIDTYNKVFENCTSLEEVNNSSACICQLPGTLSFNRIKRSLVEYPKFFIPEIIIILLLIILIYGFIKKTSKKSR